MRRHGISVDSSLMDLFFDICLIMRLSVLEALRNRLMGPHKPISARIWAQTLLAFLQISLFACFQRDGVCTEGRRREEEAGGGGKGSFGWNPESSSEGNYLHTHIRTCQCTSLRFIATVSDCEIIQSPFSLVILWAHMEKIYCSI